MPLFQPCFLHLFRYQKLSGRGVIFYFSFFFQLGEQPVRFGVLSGSVSHIFACTDKENSLFFLVKEFGQLVFRLFQVGRLIVQTHHILVETHVLRSEDTY